MAALDLNVLALALLGATAVAFSRQRRMVMLVCGGLFVAVAAGATLASWWALSPAVAVAALGLGLGLPLLTLALFAVDTIWAPFALEMTYPALICWIAWPALVLANWAALAIAPVA